MDLFILFGIWKADFWRCIFEQRILIIVMTTRTVERGRTKCGQYWPPDKDSSVCHEGFRIENTNVESYPDYVLTRLNLINTKVFSKQKFIYFRLVFY